MTKPKTAAQQELTVERRPAIGTRPVRRLRRLGAIPGIVYGRSMDPITVSVNQREFLRLLHSKTGEHALVTLRLKDAAPSTSLRAASRAESRDAAPSTTLGGTFWEKPVLVKAVQHDPVDGHITHIDFHAILLTERLKVKVPVLLKGEAVGVKQEGGILEHFLREVEVECLPAEIPAGVEFDVSAMNVGATVHVRDLVAPKNAKITSDADGVIASIQMPKEEKPEEAAGAVTEPEVIREKKEEAEAEEGAKAEKPARPGAGEGRAGAKAAGEAPKKEAKA